jgi:hypothetical protein
MAKKNRVSICRYTPPVSLVVVSLTILFIAIGCASTSSLKKENRSYNEAVKQDTIEAYSEYIANHPDGKHVEDAKKRLVELEWEKTEKSNTVKAYESFIAKYKDYPSDSDYIGLAQKHISKLNEQLALSASDMKKDANKGEKSSKFTLLKRSKSNKDSDAKVKLISLDKGEGQKVSINFFERWTHAFVRGWQKFVTFFKNIFSAIFYFQDEKIDGGRIVRAKK